MNGSEVNVSPAAASPVNGHKYPDDQQINGTGGSTESIDNNSDKVLKHDLNGHSNGVDTKTAEPIKSSSAAVKNRFAKDVYIELTAFSDSIYERGTVGKKSWEILGSN